MSVSLTVAKMCKGGGWCTNLGMWPSRVTCTLVTDRLRFKLAVLMYRCVRGTAPSYLMDSCTLTADVTGSQHLRSATQRKLIVPRYRLNAFGRRHFAVAGRRLGIRCLTDFVTQSWVSTLSSVNWRCTFLRDIDLTKRVKRIRDIFEYALYKFTLYWLT